MGLDTIEIVLRTEETFSVDLPDEVCAQVRTVGDLYRLVLTRLNLPYLPAEQAEALPHRTYISRTYHLQPWTTPDVWANLKHILVDQLQIDDDDVTERATFIHDLGCD